MKPIISMCAIAAMTCSVAAWADKPIEYPISFQVTGAPLTDCGDFLILQDYRVEGYERQYFNKDGSLNKIFRNLAFPDGVYYNANDPSYWLPGHGEQSQIWFHFDENGDLINYVYAGVELKVTVPGYGVVITQAGHMVWEFNGAAWEPKLLAGRLDYARGEFDAFCAALRP
jgi:hypothetical protein